MKSIELIKTGKSGLEGRLLKTEKFQHHTGYQMNVFPFKTQPGGYVFDADFKSFQGVIGEVLRIIKNKELDKAKNKNIESYKTDLKEMILQKALQKVSTAEKHQLESIINMIYFEPDSGLFKYNFQVIAYMNFISNKPAIKDIPIFIHQVFLENCDRFSDLLSSTEKDNIFNQLISDSLPELKDKKGSGQEKSRFVNLLPQVTDVFQEDFNFLMENKEYFLENIELFFKYYYFFYFSQLALKLNLFGKEDFEIVPVYFSMDWENLSESRLKLHKIGWKYLLKCFKSVFAHANTLELLNYIHLDGKILGSYEDITALYNNFTEEEKASFKEKYSELLSFYKTEVKTLNASANWKKCQLDLENSLENREFDQEITELIYSFWYTICYQFENGKRNKPYNDYAQWLISFCKVNYTKSGGRIGLKMVLSQETLLFLTKLCVGNSTKIRLKDYWEKLRHRGITMDETSKMEVVKLFERINLLEKKSDSGDAQYIKSSL